MSVRANVESGLPSYLTSFVGRESEIAEIRRLLGVGRLVTVTGAGGSGKSRLALEVMQRMAMEDGSEVGWVELASLERPDLLAQHLATQLSLREQPERPALEGVIDALEDRDLVLVLDNCEHLVEAAAALIDSCLRRCPAVRVLATSREALGVAGERAWLVPGLSIHGEPGEGDEVSVGEAVRLFADRAQAVSSSFQLTPANVEPVRQICRRLDGLPLAIELAAARVTVLPPEDIARRLDDVFRLLTSGSRTSIERHRTLRATVDWSYHMLSQTEQRLLERLAVFVGSFSLRAVELVCVDDEVPDDVVLDTLAALVSRSLVVMQEYGGSARYRLLEIVRQYARERLAAGPSTLAAMNRRHAEYYADLAERALPDLERHHRADWAALPQEMDNLRTAIQWAFAAGEDAIGHRLVGALWWYWGQSAQWSEGSMWLEQAVSRLGPVSDQAWGQVLNGAGTWAYMVADPDRAVRLLEEAVRVLAEAGDRLHQVMALSTLSHVHCATGDTDKAIRLGEDAVAIARTLEEAWPLVHAMCNGLGFAYESRGDFERADQCAAEAFDAAVRSGHHWGMGEAARERASTALRGFGPTRAAPHMRVAIASARAIGDPFQMARLLILSAHILAESGREATAARLIGTVTSLRKGGTLVLEFEDASQQQLAGVLTQSLGPDTWEAEVGVGAAWTPVEALAQADAELSEVGGTAASVAAPHVVGPAQASGLPADGVVGAVGSPPNETPGAEPVQPPSLSVRALGGVEILVHGAPPAGDEWSHARPRQLLVYLLCHPEGRTKEQVGLDFWPEASSVQVKNSFHVLVHRLRKALGSRDLVVSEGDRYRLDAQAGVRFDVADFEREVTEALAGSRAGRPEPDRLSRALDLYRGDFMEGEAVGDWFFAVHDRLRRLYCEALDELARQQLENGDHVGAAETLERLLEKEPLREDVCRRLMICLARSGRRDRALLHHRKLTVLLLDELGSSPEPETEALAATLQAAEPV